MQNRLKYILDQTVSILWFSVQHALRKSKFYLLVQGWTGSGAGVDRFWCRGGPAVWKFGLFQKITNNYSQRGGNPQNRLAYQSIYYCPWKTPGTSSVCQRTAAYQHGFWEEEPQNASKTAKTVDFSKIASKTSAQRHPEWSEARGPYIFWKS